MSSIKTQLSGSVWSLDVESHSQRRRSEDRLDVFAVNRGSVWFDDGSVILEVAGVHFRVYEGILALHSPLFQSFPHYLPADALRCDHKVDGRPIIVLADSPKDWAIVLSVLFHPHGQQKL